MKGQIRRYGSYVQAFACYGIEFTLSHFTMLSKNPQLLVQFLYDHHEHLILNHSVNFIDQDTGAHTHGIERKGRKVPGNIRCYSKLKHHLIGNLADFIFIKLHPGYKERTHAIFTSVSYTMAQNCLKPIIPAQTLPTATILRMTFKVNFFLSNT